MGQLIHDSSDCSITQNDPNRVHLSNVNQRTPVNGSTSPTAPGQDAISQTASNHPLDYVFVPIPDAYHQAVANRPTNRPPSVITRRVPDAHARGVAYEAVVDRPSVYTFVHEAAVENQESPVDGSADLAAPNQDLTGLTAADQALVNEFATVLAIASQIPLHRAIAIHRPVRFTVNQLMAPPRGDPFLRMMIMSMGLHDILNRWEASDYANISINEISFTLGDDSDNQPIAPNQTAPPFTDQAAADQAFVDQAIIELAAIGRPTGTAANQVTAGFFVHFYSRMFRAGGIRRDTVRRWIQSGDARLPANLDVSRLAAASAENLNEAQIAAQQWLYSRAAEATENDFQSRIQPERQQVFSFQQEQTNYSDQRYSLEGSGALEGLSDEDHDSDSTISIPNNQYPRRSETASMYAHILRNRYSTNRGSRRWVYGASSEENRRMEMQIRGRRNAIQPGIRVLPPGSNASVTLSGLPEVDDL
ncbi:hypothetical protein BOTCAL_0774g00030 [Botryotinia calthae]|uniref:Uncharacterized protein n=1 Tax=Botryotinia calthae TaxID=38488 RepID=A0A4Y8CIR4_9HELO|nr:hypothetical protein BOTCAL_0774g00030 [Botryotinia calthae]